MSKRILLKDAIVLLITSFLIMSSVMITINADCPETCPNGMVSYWKAEGNANDCFDSNHGVLKNGSVIVTPSPNHIGQTFSFDGTDKYGPHVNIPHHSSLNFGTGPFTLEAWVNYQGPDFSSEIYHYPTIISKRGVPNDGFIFGIFYYSGIPGSPYIQIEGINYHYCWNRVDDGNWHHVAVTRNNNHVITFYIDGNFAGDGGGAIVNKDMNSNHALWIGNDYPTDHKPDWGEWEGLIDEVAVYNRALSLDELHEHWSDGINLHLGYCDRTVHNLNTDRWYHWIQDGVDDATAGDTIEVYDPSLALHPTGEYVEHVELYKQLTLQAAANNNPIIDGGGNGDAVHVTASNSVVKGFVIQDADIGVHLDSCVESTIYNNIIKDNNVYGVYCKASENTVLENEIIDNVYGIYLDTSNSNDLDSNTITKNYLGIRLVDSNNNDIMLNCIESNDKYGIDLSNSDSNPTYCNYIDSNEYGIYLDVSSGNEIHSNTFNNNEKYGVINTASSSGYTNDIHDNNFLQNSCSGNAFDPYTDINWHSNYWNDWYKNAGHPTNTYEIPGGSNKDNTPSANPNDNSNCPNFYLMDISKDDGLNGASVDILDKITYTIQYTNPNNYLITDVVIIDYLDHETSWISSEDQNGAPAYDYDATKHCFTWDIGTVFDGEVGQVTMTVQVIGNDRDYVNNYVILETDKKIQAIASISTPIDIGGNIPPIPVDITGPPSGKTNVEYTYTLTATDPNGDDICYYVEWGDESNSGWLGPYNSGETTTAKHTWAEQGTYTIKAKAKDAYDLEGDWGTLEVSMPKSKSYTYKLSIEFLQHYPLLYQLLLRFFHIKNI